MYTIGDFLIQIKNGYLARKRQIEYPSSRVINAIGGILTKEGYLGKISRKAGSDPKKTKREMLLIELKYEGRVPAISEIKIISKPSVHYYATKSNMRKYAGKYGTSILSTSKGVMTGKEAQKQGVGGEIICQIF